MHPRHILHTFQTYLVHVLDVSSSEKKGRGTHICLAAVLPQGFVLAQTRLVRVPDASRARLRGVLHTLQMRLQTCPNAT